MNSSLTFFWFRRDLRLHDNTALAHALNSGQKVQCVFIFDTTILNKLTDKNDARVVFIHQHLNLINEELLKLGSSLLVEYSTPLKAWEKWIKDFQISKIVTNDDYEPAARKRDEEIRLLCSRNNIEFLTFKDHVVFEKNEVVKDDGLPYTVFTPYKNKWLKALEFSQPMISSYHKQLKNLNNSTNFKIPALENMGFRNFEFSFPSSAISNTVLKEYGNRRDYPAMDGTSRLSIHLRFGTVSIRELVIAAIKLKSEVWLNELIWRDFYQMILWHFPYIVSGSFKPHYDRIPWRNNELEFQKWCEGKTGFPIVDAGMRELNNTGFMHNRVRMITASFLTKHLLIDWRWGEAYFAQKLLDYDLASNVGGWQWAAGSGCDAAPYFRIFNPYEQTRKFDPELKYIRKWVPELDTFDYPQPMVEHKFARDRCLTVYKKALTEKV